MSKTLVAYFSASGVTENRAKQLASAAGADLFEIRPVKKYTREDLDWTNKRSRSTVESQNPDARPAIAKKVENLDQYDKVAVGFPVWWYTAPRIINTFLEENDLSGKAVYIFATSGGSGADKCMKDLKKQYPAVDFRSAKLLNGAVNSESLKNWMG